MFVNFKFLCEMFVFQVALYLFVKKLFIVWRSFIHVLQDLYVFSVYGLDCCITFLFGYDLNKTNHFRRSVKRPLHHEPPLSCIFWCWRVIYLLLLCNVQDGCFCLGSDMNFGYNNVSGVSRPYAVFSQIGSRISDYSLW